MKINKDTKFLIVGLGLIGGSYAQMLHDKGYFVGAVDINQNSIDYSLKKGFIDIGSNKADEIFISDFDIIIFALYPEDFYNWIMNNQHMIKKNALITDVTGVKTGIIYKIQKTLRDDLEFIGAHPMAGRESRGVENADKSVFIGANYIVTPTEKNTNEGIECCKALGRILGFGNITELSPESHDEMIGFLSQLTHCIAVSLMTCRDSEAFASYTGDSFRDLTRIAKINSEMWSDLFLMNRDILLKQMDMFEEQFGLLKHFIYNKDKESIKNMMDISTEKRLLFEKTGGKNK